MALTQKKKLKQPKSAIFEETHVLDLANKDFKVGIINVLKALKETMFNN